MSLKNRAVFLDRDGVLNETIFRDGKPRAPDTLAEFRWISGVKEAVAALKSAGFVTVVVTNQPDVARGWQKKEVVEAMNQKVLDELQVHQIKVCYHDDLDQCTCRKPQPGMLLEAIEEWNLDPKLSYMIGDREGDMEAGRAAGCTPLLILNPHSASPDTESAALLTLHSLKEAVEWILAARR